jgi:hypothetical protein
VGAAEHSPCRLIVPISGYHDPDQTGTERNTVTSAGAPWLRTGVLARYRGGRAEEFADVAFVPLAPGPS